MRLHDRRPKRVGGIGSSSKGEDKENETQSLLRDPVPRPDSIRYGAVPAKTFRVLELIDVPCVDNELASRDDKLISLFQVDSLPCVLFSSPQRSSVDDIPLSSDRDESPTD